MWDIPERYVISDSILRRAARGDGSAPPPPPPFPLGRASAARGHELLEDEEVHLEARLEAPRPGQQLQRLPDVFVLLGLQTHAVVRLPDAPQVVVHGLEVHPQGRLAPAAEAADPLAPLLGEL